MKIIDNTLGLSDSESGKYLRVSQDPETGIYWGVTHDGQVEAVQSMTKTTRRPTEIERLGKGASDITSGVKQAYLFHTDPKEYGRYTADREKDLEYYNRALREWGDGGLDMWGLAGEAGMVAPVGMANFGRTWIGRGASSVGQGAVAGGAMFAPTEGNRLVNAAAGALGGAAALPIGATLKRAGAAGATGALSALNKLRSAVIPDSQLTVRIQNEFPAISGLAAPVREKVMAEARRQLTQHGDFDAASLERIARAEELGFVGDTALTTGQASRSGVLFDREQTLARLEDGLELRSRFTAQNRRLAEELREDLPRSTVARSETGSAVIDSINDRWDQTQKSVGKVYDLVKNRYGDATVDAGLPKLQAFLEEEITDPNNTIAKAAYNKGRQMGIFGDEVQPVTVTQLEQFRKWIGRRSDKNEPELRRFKRMTIDALDDDVVETFGDDVFKVARDKARERFNMFNSNLVSRVVDGKIQGDSLYKKVLAADSSDVKQMRYLLEMTDEGKEAWQALRSTAIDDIWRSAAPDGAERTFNPSRFRNAMEKIGENKMKVLFSPDELARLEDIRKASIDMIVAPPFDSINRSNTAPTLMNIMRRVPTVGGEIAGKVDDAIRSSQNLVEVERATAGQGRPALTVPEVMRNIEDLSQGRVGQILSPMKTGAVVAPGLISGQYGQQRGE